MGDEAPGAGNVPGSAAPSRPAASDHRYPISGSWRIATATAIIMVLLAMLGVGLTTTERSIAATYWMALVPVFGLLCMAMAWARARHEGKPHTSAMLRQLFHWLGIAVALGLDFALRRAGEETGAAAGLNALLVLALGCYLAGVHLEVLFALVGLLLTVVLIIMTTAEQYMWLLFVIGGVAVFGLLALQWIVRKRHAHAANPAAAAAAGR